MRNASFLSPPRRSAVWHFIMGWLLLWSTSSFSQNGSAFPKDKVAADFKAMIGRPAVPFAPSFSTVKKDSVEIQKGFIYSEKDEKIPVLIYKPIRADVRSFPVVICLHGTGGTKEGKEMLGFLQRLSGAGYMAVSIDARFHGERIAGGSNGSMQYVEAIAKAWKSKEKEQLHPFFYDTVYDILRLTDYLVSRPDVQAGRIGMTGVSMGGIETYMAAAVDERIKVVVPIIAAQSFKWSLENNRWQGRARTIQAAHEQAAKDLGDSSLNAKNVSVLWDKVVPGITGEFDCPSMIRLIAPRPMLLLSNEKDNNCPLPGALIAFESAAAEYKKLGAENKLKTNVTPDKPHGLVPVHVDMAMAWFQQWL